MTLDEIAKKHGYTYTKIGSKAATVYRFTGTDLIVRGFVVDISRAGHGSLFIEWEGFPVPWRPYFTDGAGVYHSPAQDTREAYVEALLPLLTNEEAVRRIGLEIRTQIEHEQSRLKAANARKEKFLAVVPMCYMDLALAHKDVTHSPVDERPQV